MTLQDLYIEVYFYGVFEDEYMKLIQDSKKLITLSDDGTWIKSIKDKSVEALAIPEGVEYIFGLNEYKKLEKIVFPESLVDISDESCLECDNFEIIVIPPKVKHIGSIAFDGCSNLREVYITSRYVVIDAGAFASTDSLCHIYLLISELEEIDIDRYAFDDRHYEECTLHVPTEIYADCLAHPVLRLFKKIEITYLFEPIEISSSDDGDAENNDSINEDDWLDSDFEEDDDEEDYDDDEYDKDWQDQEIEEFSDFVAFFDGFEDDTVFKVLYTNKEYKCHHFRITDVKESAIYGSKYIDAYCIDKDGEYEGIERTFRIERFLSVEIDD